MRADEAKQRVAVPRDDRVGGAVDAEDRDVPGRVCVLGVTDGDALSVSRAVLHDTGCAQGRNTEIVRHPAGFKACGQASTDRLSIELSPDGVGDGVRFCPKL